MYKSDSPHRCFTVWVSSIHCSLRVVCVCAGRQSVTGIVSPQSHDLVKVSWAEVDWLIEGMCVVHVHVHVCGMYMCILCGKLANSTLSSGHVKFSMSVHGLWLKRLADIIHVYCAWSVLVCMCVWMFVGSCLATKGVGHRKVGQWWTEVNYQQIST